MNPGPVEEVGATARTTVDALKASPIMLAVIVLQMVVFGIMAWWSFERNRYEASVNTIFEHHIEQLIKQCGPIQRSDIPLPLPFPHDVPRG